DIDFVGNVGIRGAQRTGGGGAVVELAHQQVGGPPHRGPENVVAVLALAQRAESIVAAGQPSSSLAVTGHQDWRGGWNPGKERVLRGKRRCGLTEAKD